MRMIDMKIYVMNNTNFSLPSHYYFHANSIGLICDMKKRRTLIFDVVFQRKKGGTTLEKAV